MQPRVSVTAARIVKSGAHLKALLDDLIDFNRTNLGLGIHIAPIGVNLAQLFADALEQLRVSHPARQIELQVIGDVSGTWDPLRLQQVLNNLVLNALKYGTHEAPVQVVIVGTPGEVEFRVHNRGPKIEQFALEHIFTRLCAAPVRESVPTKVMGAWGLDFILPARLPSLTEAISTCDRMRSKPCLRCDCRG